MRKRGLLLVVLFLSITTYAQETIEAKTILKAIKDGKTIKYTNKTIVGVLDFTFMEEASKKNTKKKKSWWNKGNSNYNTINQKIKVAISFTNCTFNDDVLAYIPDEESGNTFTADFEEKSSFINCKFKSSAMFKYSKFSKDSDFSGTNFLDDTSFKYAKFITNSSFKETLFSKVATFKYAIFKENVSFENTTFKSSATFKYAKFNNGVSFQNVNFEKDLNIKYMNVSDPFIIKNMNVGNDIDDKYTKINGKSFSKYVLENNN